MTLTAIDSPLLRMTRETPTDWWNDSCDPDDLAFAIERGATGATSNPTIVLEVMKRNRAYWWPRVRELANGNGSTPPTAGRRRKSAAASASSLIDASGSQIGLWNELGVQCAICYRHGSRPVKSGRGTRCNGVWKS